MLHAVESAPLSAHTARPARTNNKAPFTLLLQFDVFCISRLILPCEQGRYFTSHKSPDEQRYTNTHILLYTHTIKPSEW